MSWRDRWHLALDFIEYGARRSICRVFGHRWEPQFEDMGEQSVLDGHFCLTCHSWRLP